MAGTLMVRGPRFTNGEYEFEIVSTIAGDTWAKLASTEMEEILEVANLFAAAPDMLAALEEAVSLYGIPGGPWNVPSDPGGWLKQARAAIAKAKAKGGN